jgi:hypothetical protein
MTLSADLQTASDLRPAAEARARVASQQADDTRRKVESYVQKLVADDRRAQEEADRLDREIQTLAAEGEQQSARARDPALASNERLLAQDAAQRTVTALKAKKRERQTFIQNARRSLQQRLDALRAMSPGADAFITLPPNFPTLGGAEFQLPVAPGDSAQRGQPPGADRSGTTREIQSGSWLLR